MSLYAPKDYKHLFGLNGFSDILLSNHCTLYEGYVTNTNKVADRLMALIVSGETGTPEYAELKRRYGWEWNGMRLHELYFDNLSKEFHELKDASPLKQQIAKDFGGFENWEKDFRATGSLRGIGWVILSYDSEIKQLFNTWINEHDMGHLAGTIPLLVMDVFEHAYMLDYGIKRADYIGTFFQSVDWVTVEKRFSK